MIQPIDNQQCYVGAAICGHQRGPQVVVSNRLEEANIATNLFHQSRTVSGQMSMPRSKQQILDVAKAEWEAHVHHHHEADYLGR